MLQGIGVGGEWGGSVLISMEWARSHGSRGLVASWPQFGVPSGLFLSNLVILAVSAWTGADFATWGWRVPFFLSIVLIGVGLWIRLGILETPVFRQLLESNQIERTPIIEVIRRQPREIILSALLRMAEQAPFYIFTAFVFAYGTSTLKMPRDLILSAVLVASCVSFVTIPLSGHISDRIGRRNMYLIGAAVTGLFGFLYFGMLDSAVPSAVFIAIVLSLIPHDMMYGPQAALIAEAFTPRLRYSGASLGYQLASVIAGGPAPLIATALFAAYHTGYAIAIYIAACAVVSLISAALMPDYTGQDISAEYQISRDEAAWPGYRATTPAPSSARTTPIATSSATNPAAATRADAQRQPEREPLQPQAPSPAPNSCAAWSSSGGAPSRPGMLNTTSSRYCTTLHQFHMRDEPRPSRAQPHRADQPVRQHRKCRTSRRRYEIRSRAKHMRRMRRQRPPRSRPAGAGR